MRTLATALLLGLSAVETDAHRPDARLEKLRGSGKLEALLRLLNGTAIEQAIYSAASAYQGTSTTAGPNGGVDACAWAVNQVISNAGLSPIGDNPNSVTSVVEGILNGRGVQINEGDATAGDLIASCDNDHIGICMSDGCSTILSNSSNRLCFCWVSGPNFDDYFGCGDGTWYQVTN